MTENNSHANDNAKTNKSVPDGCIPYDIRDNPDGKPSPYIFGMAMMECNSIEELLRAINSVQKELIRDVIEITKQTISVSQQYTDANIDCLQKQIVSLQEIIQAIYGMISKAVDTVKKPRPRKNKRDNKPFA